MGKYEFLPAVAGILGLVSFSSLLKNIHDTHNTSTLTWTWIMVNIAGQLLVLLYGLANKAPGLYGPTIVFILGLFYILYVKFYTEDLPTADKAVDKDVKKVV
jgi:uncharacterized membrane protein